MAETVISHDEWMRAIEDVFARTGDAGLTARELGDALGCGERATHTRLQALARANRLIVGRARRQSLIGLPIMVPVYRIKPVGE